MPEFHVCPDCRGTGTKDRLGPMTQDYLEQEFGNGSELDEFLEEQLKPHLLQEAFRSAGIPLTLRYQACNDVACLPPVKLALEADVVIAAAGAKAVPVNQKIFSGK